MKYINVFRHQNEGCCCSFEFPEVLRKRTRTEVPWHCIRLDKNKHTLVLAPNILSVRVRAWMLLHQEPAPGTCTSTRNLRTYNNKIQQQDNYLHPSPCATMFCFVPTVLAPKRRGPPALALLWRPVVVARTSHWRRGLRPSFETRKKYCHQK